MFGRKRFDPDRANVLGESNQDSYFGPEFTFHHGHVERVITSASDLEGVNITYSKIPKSSLSQCIVITPTFGDNLGLNLPSNYLKGKLIALPLLRGFSDSITQGDSVIYTELGDTFFYLGPINTLNNPNYCPDSLYDAKAKLPSNNIVLDKSDENSDGYNKNFIATLVNKAFKDRSPLDRPYNIGVGELNSLAEQKSAYSDIQIEGRHNNSVQLGSRFISPYLTIKNNSTVDNNGSVLGMLSLGTIVDFFPNKFTSAEKTNLSSDLEILRQQPETSDGEYKGFLIGHGNDIGEEEKPQNKFDMSYGGLAKSPSQQTEFDQIIMFSDKITFDAQENDFTVSAFRNINFGAVGNFTITNKGFSVIESKNIYIGEHAKEKKEPMVLGDELRLLLLDIMNILLDSRALVQGVALPLVDKAPGTLMDIRINQMIKKLEDMRTTPENSFLSDYHYIEPNAGNPNRS